MNMEYSFFLLKIFDNIRNQVLKVDYVKHLMINGMVGVCLQLNSISP